MVDWLAPLTRDFTRSPALLDTLRDADVAVRDAGASAEIVRAWEHVRDTAVRCLAHPHGSESTDDRLLLSCGGLDALLILMRPDPD